MSDRDADAEDATLRDAVAAALGSEAESVAPLDGGMIGEVHRIDLADGRTVVAKRGETPLTVEAEMLGYLTEHTSLPVPEVLSADDDLLLLEYVEGESDFSPAAERDAAAHLAALHDVTADRFGFERDTLLGPHVLDNERCDSWIEFFRERRLLHFATMADDEGTVPEETIRRVERLAADLDDLLVEPAAPALLHGDVWRENVLASGASEDSSELRSEGVLASGGTVTAFLDPAIYYGSPEEELAYVRWTGAFGDPFFERYRELRGIADGFEERWRVYAVPRLLIHAILFGGEYPRRTAEMLGRIGY